MNWNNISLKFTLKCKVIIVVLGVGGYTKAPANYNDVAVIVNTNSSTSMAIGEYFRIARSIPTSNMIHVNTPTNEEIDSTTFEALRAQIENYLLTNNLAASINYIVTTKGVPLKVNRGDTYSATSPSSSVESELACILGAYSTYVGQPGRITSPYYYQSDHFSRATYGMYLVTRLDAYTLQQVFELIDRSGPSVSVNQTSKFVFDQDPAWNASLASLNNNMTIAKSTLDGKGIVTELNTDTVFVTGRTDVVGYMSWGSNDHYDGHFTTNAVPMNTWSRGAITETYVSTSARTFETPAIYGQSLIADLVEEGVAGAKGYVYEPFSSSMAVAFLLFDRYTSGYNLAESFYLASRYISWMDVVIGDPKTTITFESPLPIQLYYFNVALSATSNEVTITWGTLSELNNYGFTIQWTDSAAQGFVDLPGSFTPGHGTTLVPQEYSWTHTNVPAGTYAYRLRQIDLDGTIHFTESQTITVGTLSEVNQHHENPRGFRLAQNYPNPFNPSTTIQFEVAEFGHVALKVYDAAGREVATLLDEPRVPGVHSVTFEPEKDGEAGLAVSSGVYFYTLHSGIQTETKKMILVK